MSPGGTTEGQSRSTSAVPPGNAGQRRATPGNAGQRRATPLRIVGRKNIESSKDENAIQA